MYIPTYLHDLPTYMYLSLSLSSNELKLQAKMLSKEIRDAKRKELLDEMERRKKEESE